jgi:hypothetical protein
LKNLMEKDFFKSINYLHLIKVNVLKSGRDFLLRFSINLIVKNQSSLDPPATCRAGFCFFSLRKSKI